MCVGSPWDVLISFPTICYRTWHNGHHTVFSHCPTVLAATVASAFPPGATENDVRQLVPEHDQPHPQPSSGQGVIDAWPCGSGIPVWLLIPWGRWTDYLHTRWWALSFAEKDELWLVAGAEARSWQESQATVRARHLCHRGASQHTAFITDQQPNNNLTSTLLAGCLQLAQPVLSDTVLRYSICTSACCVSVNVLSVLEGRHRAFVSLCVCVSQVCNFLYIHKKFI